MSKLKAVHTDRTRALTEQLNEIDTLEELQAVFDAANGRWAQITAQHLQDFKIGQRVTWRKEGGRHRGNHAGYIVGFTGTSAKCVSDSGANWTVASVHLRPAKEIT